MTQNKILTSTQQATVSPIQPLEVREVMNEVREKPISITIFYNILTCLTSFLHIPCIARARTRAHESILKFRGKEVRNYHIRYAELEKILTSDITSLPIKPFPYLKSSLTQIYSVTEV